MKLSKAAAVLLVILIVLLLFDRHAPVKRDFSLPQGSVQTASMELENAVAETGAALTQDITESRSNALPRAVQPVSPAVVGISTKGVQRYRVRDPFFELFYPRMYEREVSGLGSGFIISPDGYIVTNDHVVENAQEITVTLTNKKKYNAHIVNRDFASDIALLKIDDDNLTYIEMGNSDEIIIGEWVIALGNPFGLFEINDQPSVTVGVVSATGRDFGQHSNERYYNDMIQTDASINPGNSGGPLVNSLGKVIGVNAFILTGGNTQSGSVGIGFAIPINKVQRIVNELRATAGEQGTYYTGIEVHPINLMLQYQFRLQTREGALITKIDADSPGEKAGLRTGDVIVQIDAVRMRSPNEIVEYLNRINARPGLSLNIKILRDNRLLETELTLERPKKD